MYRHGGKVVILHLPISYSVLCAKNYENWLAVVKVIAKISRLTFLAHPEQLEKNGGGSTDRAG